MIYRIVCSGQDIYSDTLETSVISPSLELELNSAGTLSFTLPPEHENWFLPNVFADEVDVYEDGKIIWFGRPLQVTRDWNNQKKVICEGALAYFNDSIQRPLEYEEKKSCLYEDADAYPGCKGFFNDIIETHNRQVPMNRQILIGNITVDNCNVYRNVDYNTTADCLQQMCLDTNGGYFILRKEYESDTGEYVRYIDWLKALDGATDQPAQFGLNMLDMSQDLNGADICTVLIPTGANDLTVANCDTYDDEHPNPYDPIGSNEHHVQHVAGSDELVHKEGYERYGRVLKQKDWSDYSDKLELLREATEWLIEQNTDIPTIECSAADLHYLDEYSDYIPFKVGQLVQVNSEPHNISRALPIYKISMQLDTGIKRMTIGTPPKRELTDIVKSGGGSTRSSSGGSSSGGSSGGGSVTIPVKDVRVKSAGSGSFKSVVKKKIAEIDLSDLGNNGVSDVQVNGETVVDENKIAKISVPEVDYPVTDVQVDGTSVVENKVAKIPKVTDVVPNPEFGMIKEQLEFIRVDNDIYSIPLGYTAGENITIEDEYGKNDYDYLFADQDSIINAISLGMDEYKNCMEKYFSYSISISDFSKAFDTQGRTRRMSRLTGMMLQIIPSETLWVGYDPTPNTNPEFFFGSGNNTASYSDKVLGLYVMWDGGHHHSESIEAVNVNVDFYMYEYNAAGELTNETVINNHYNSLKYSNFQQKHDDLSSTSGGLEWKSYFLDNAGITYMFMPVFSTSEDGIKWSNLVTTYKNNPTFTNLRALKDHLAEFSLNPPSKTNRKIISAHFSDIKYPVTDVLLDGESVLDGTVAKLTSSGGGSSSNIFETVFESCNSELYDNTRRIATYTTKEPGLYLILLLNCGNEIHYFPGSDEGKYRYHNSSYYDDDSSRLNMEQVDLVYLTKGSEIYFIKLHDDESVDSVYMRIVKINTIQDNVKFEIINNPALGRRSNIEEIAYTFPSYTDNDPDLFLVLGSTLGYGYANVDSFLSYDSINEEFDITDEDSGDWAKGSFFLALSNFGSARDKTIRIDQGGFINNLYVWRLYRSSSGVSDVTVNGSSVVNSTGVAVLSDIATSSDISSLRSNFQAGVDSVYNACVSKGSTPASHSLADVIQGILDISGGGGSGGTNTIEYYLPSVTSYTYMLAENFEVNQPSV